MFHPHIGLTVRANAGAQVDADRRKCVRHNIVTCVNMGRGMYEGMIVPDESITVSDQPSQHATGALIMLAAWATYGA